MYRDYVEVESRYFLAPFGVDAGRMKARDKIKVLLLGLSFYLKFCLATGERSTDKGDFPDFGIQPPQYAYAVPGSVLQLPCYAVCSPNCSFQAEILWEKDGAIIDSSDPFLQIFINGTLRIKSFMSKDVGRYTCLAKFGRWATIRSTPSTVAVAEIRDVLVHGFPVQLGGSTIISCVAIGTPYKFPLKYAWYKEGTVIEDGSPNHKVDTAGNLHVQDVGRNSMDNRYRCRSYSELFGISSESQEIRLNVTEVPRSVLLIVYLTGDSEVEQGSPFDISCVAYGSGVPGVRLLKLAEGSQIETEVAHGNYSTRLHLPGVHILEGGTYVCEAQLDQTVIRREMALKVLVKPTIVMLTHRHMIRKPGEEIFFICQTPHVFPKVNHTFYRGGVPVDYSTKNYRLYYDYVLYFLDLKVEMSDFYQCVVENKVGVDSFIYRLSVSSETVAPLSPQRLKFDALSPTLAKLTWVAPPGERPQFYLILWQNLESGKRNSQFTEATSYVIKPSDFDPGPHGGVTYQFRVCTLYTRVTGEHNCSSLVATMPEDIPLSPPFLHDLIYEGNFRLRVSWDHIPVHRSQGIIQKYTVYVLCVSFGKLDDYKVFTVDKDATSTYVTLPTSGYYKVEVSGSTRMGEGPRSRALIVGVRKEKRIDLERPDVTAEWQKDGKLYVARLKWRLHPDVVEPASHMQISYTPIPCKDYWLQAKSDLVSPDSTEFVIPGIGSYPRAQYRVEVRPLFGERIGHSGVAVLHQDLNNVFSRLLMDNPVIVSAPQDIKLLPRPDCRSLYVTWNKETIQHGDVTHGGYELSVFSDADTEKITVYRTMEKYYLLSDLEPGTWYYVFLRVHATSDGRDVYVSTSSIFACKTDDVVSSAPTNVSVHSVQSRGNSAVRWVVRWKPPLLPGGLISAYYVYMQPVTTSSDQPEPRLNRPPVASLTQRKVVTLSASNRLQLEADLPTAGVYKYDIQIAAVNEAGEGVRANCSFDNVMRDFPRPSDGTHPRSGDGVDVKLGIIVGSSIGASLILAAFVFYIFRNLLFKKATSTLVVAMEADGSRMDDEASSFLYLQKLQEYQRGDERAVFCTLDKTTGKCFVNHVSSPCRYKHKKSKRKIWNFCLSRSSVDRGSGSSRTCSCSCPVHGGIHGGPILQVLHAISSSDCYTDRIDRSSVEGGTLSSSKRHSSDNAFPAQIHLQGLLRESSGTSSTLISSDKSDASADSRLSTDSAVVLSSNDSSV